MNLGFSSPVHPALSSPKVATEAFGARVNPLLARTVFVADVFFGVIGVNRHYVARMAVLTPSSRDDDTLDKKRAKNIIRKLKTEKTEPSNDQRPQ